MTECPPQLTTGHLAPSGFHEGLAQSCCRCKKGTGACQLGGLAPHMSSLVQFMAELIGAEFSKPLKVFHVTHLVCYDFTGRLTEGKAST